MMYGVCPGNDHLHGIIFQLVILVQIGVGQNVNKLKPETINCGIGQESVMSIQPETYRISDRLLQAVSFSFSSSAA
jgi:hypothetical protein